jgi:hypothetical protein
MQVNEQNAAGRSEYHKNPLEMIVAEACPEQEH